VGLKKMNAFPKIFTIGHKYIKNIFDDEVEITEKIDGSQLGFGKINNSLIIRSKGKEQQLEYPDKLFFEGIEYIKLIQDKLPNGYMFYGEYLKKPKHNCLCYNNIPKNHIVLFGVCTEDKTFYNYEELKKYANLLNIDVIPLLYKGKINNANELKELLKYKSYLGGVNVEGVVIKNYNKDLMIGGHIIPIMCGKYVSEEFKEVHKRDWKRNNTIKGKWEIYKESFKTKARWLKAVQYLRDNNEIEGTPVDIGKIMKRIHEDITCECKEQIKDFLWKEFGKEVLKTATKGVAEWYKEKLLDENFIDN
jgi:hypothetical protein